MIGIYKITNKINNKVYIGQSNCIERRIADHIKCLTLKKHKNKHLQSAVNKHSIINFNFEIIEECIEEMLNKRENYWIEFYNSHKSEFGYNSIIGEFYKPIKLTNQEKHEIVKIFENDPYASKFDVAEKFDVSYSTIYGVLQEFDIDNPKKICSEETKIKLKKINTGKVLSDDTKSKIGKASSELQVLKKYSQEKINEVISLLLQGLDNVEIQKITGINYSVINGVRNKNTWIEFTKDFEFPKIKAPDNGRGNSKLTDKQILEIVDLMREGLTNKEIMDKLNISFTMVNGIRNKKTFKYLTENIEIPIIKQKNQYK
jgi:group I intron endonuclease